MSEQLYVKFTPATESGNATIHGHNGFFCSTAITLKAKLCCSSACQALVCVQTISRGGAGGVLSKYLYATILYIITLLRCAFSTLHIIILWIVRSSLEDKQLGSMYSSLRR